MGEKNWYRLKKNSKVEFGYQHEKLSEWMKKTEIHEKFKVRKLVWEPAEKISTEKNYNWKIDVKN